MLNVFVKQEYEHIERFKKKKNSVKIVLIVLNVNSLTAKSFIILYSWILQEVF